MILMWNFDKQLNVKREKKTTSKKINDDVMSANYNAIVIFSNIWPILSNPEAGFLTNSL